MVRAKKYIDIDVVEAARQRIRHIYELFDSVAVCWSGGKDSSVCLALAKEVHEEYNLGPVDVIFRDEEVINFSVIDFVAQFREDPSINLRWYALPNAESRMLFGRRLPYISWDPNREWARPMPEWALTAEKLGLPSDLVVNEYTQDDIIARDFKGSVAFITGIRATESLVRFRSVTQKLNENYINRIEGNTKSRVRLCKPIYDWTVDDVLKFLYETETPICPVYQAQEMAQAGLRVATPFHPEAIRKLHFLREVEPEFYDALLRIFPEMEAQDRYANDFDKKQLLVSYRRTDPDDFSGVFAWIEDNIEPRNRQMALKRTQEWKGRHRRDPENYPVDMLLEIVAFGALERRLTGKYVDSKK